MTSSGASASSLEEITPNQPPSSNGRSRTIMRYVCIQLAVTVDELNRSVLKKEIIDVSTSIILFFYVKKGEPQLPTKRAKRLMNFGNLSW